MGKKYRFSAGVFFLMWQRSEICASRHVSFTCCKGV